MNKIDNDVKNQLVRSLIEKLLLQPQKTSRLPPLEYFYANFLSKRTISVTQNYRYSGHC